ncbi:MAG: YdiU family protein, partial [Kiritimatiellae bacterium]|nr:YdiU family protein [Kiritimatiellia bacterium]
MPNPIPFDNTYARLPERFYSKQRAAAVPTPQWLRANTTLATELGIDPAWLETTEALHVFAGNSTADGSEPLAQAYAGHQFGGFSPQLGDGRALLLGEVVDQHGTRRDIQLKGSGRTSFSRGGDGKSALGPVLREYIVSEAMHALGVPTTRALAAVTTGENVLRQEGAMAGGVFTRVASSHIRVGTFQYFFARNDTDALRELADYTIARHYPDAANAEEPYIALLERVIETQAKLIPQWMALGFIHGVMNTDNTAVSGETIDYGPCAFMDDFHPKCVFSSIDRDGRYAWGSQPEMAHWNLNRFAETLLPLISEDLDVALEKAEKTLGTFTDVFRAEYDSRFR